MFKLFEIVDTRSGYLNYFCPVTLDKYMHNSIKTNFPHVKAYHMRQIAKSAECDETYVRKVLNGDREVKSALSKRIFKAATILNKKLEKTLDQVQKIASPENED